jgi:hypothetical protein
VAYEEDQHDEVADLAEGADDGEEQLPETYPRSSQFEYAEQPQRAESRDCREHAPRYALILRVEDLLGQGDHHDEGIEDVHRVAKILLEAVPYRLFGKITYELHDHLHEEEESEHEVGGLQIIDFLLRLRVPIEREHHCVADNEDRHDQIKTPVLYG